MRRAVIVSNGFMDNYDYYKKNMKKDDYIICADGAIRHCIAMQICPDLWIGDFDSCDCEQIIEGNPILQNCERISLNPIKDETDTHTCCIYAIQRGYTDIIIWGVFGGRADHMLSCIFLLEYLLEQGVRARIQDTQNDICIFDNELTVTRRKNTYLSLIPINSSVKVIYAIGVAYPLKDEILYRMQSRGVSNEIVEDKAIIKITNGKMLAVISSDEKCN